MNSNICIMKLYPLTIQIYFSSYISKWMCHHSYSCWFWRSFSLAVCSVWCWFKLYRPMQALLVNSSAGNYLHQSYQDIMIELFDFHTDHSWADNSALSKWSSTAKGNRFVLVIQYIRHTSLQLEDLLLKICSYKYWTPLL